MTKLKLFRISFIYIGLAILLSFVPIAGGADEVSDNIDALHSTSVAKRADAAEALAKLHSRKAIHSLIVALADPVEPVRAQALRALAATVKRADVPLLIRTLNSPNIPTQIGAARLLAIFGDRRAGDSLIALVGTNDLTLKAAVTDALAKIGDPRAAASLRSGLQNKNARIRMKTAYALGDRKSVV